MQDQDSKTMRPYQVSLRDLEDNEDYAYGSRSARQSRGMDDSNIRQSIPMNVNQGLPQNQSNFLQGQNQNFAPDMMQQMNNQQNFQ